MADEMMDKDPGLWRRRGRRRRTSPRPMCMRRMIWRRSCRSARAVPYGGGRAAALDEAGSPICPKASRGRFGAVGATTPCATTRASSRFKVGAKLDAYRFQLTASHPTLRRIRSRRFPSFPARRVICA